MVFCIILSALIFLVPSEAFAWGPIAHIDFAAAILKNLSAYSPDIQRLLSSYPRDFLYGAIAADVTVGKKYVDYIYNCHNWRVGFLILNEAASDRQRACAYGYLVHLASDVVAHNFFVPFKIIRSYPTQTLGHIYWEMRFDARRPRRMWQLARDLCKTDFSHNDELFQKVLRRTLFSFKTNKRIFNSIMNLHKFRHWRTGMGHLDRISKWTLSLDTIRFYRKMVFDSVLAFLKDPENAPCTKVDPTGRDKLLYAKEIRKRLHDAHRKKYVDSTLADHFVMDVKAALEEGIYKEANLPEVVDIFV